MDESKINAMFGALIEQRNNALNQVANLAGELAVANARIKELSDLLQGANEEEVKNG